MRTFFLAICFTAAFGLVHGQTDLNRHLDKADSFFKKHVMNGRVAYSMVHANPQELDELIVEIADFVIDPLNSEQRKAFLINSYNLLVIHSLVQHYPVQSPMEIGGFFDQQKHVVGAKKMTLNELEKNELIAITGDPRLHFVLVCGALGCPAIASFAYRPEILDQQLKEATQKAMNDPDFMKVNTTDQSVKLSEIFTWYAKDFKKNDASVLDFINRFRSTPIPAEFKQSSYTYDWSINANAAIADLPLAPTETKQLSNVQAFTPSVLLKKGQFEINNFNNLYTQKNIRNSAGDELALTERQSFLSNLFQFTYGISRKSNINIGWDVVVNSAYYDSEKGSPLELFSPKEGFSRTVVGAMGPRIKFTPLANLTNLSIQSTFTFPLENNLEVPNFVAHDRYTWNTQFFYDQSLSSQFRLFFEADFLYRIKRKKEQSNFFRTPVTAIVSYFPTDKTTLYLLLQHAPAFGKLTNENRTQFGQLRWFSQYGIGGKYQLTSRLGIELSYTDFFLSRSDGAGTTYNLGFRYIH